MKDRRLFFCVVLAVLGACAFEDGESSFFLDLPSLPPSWTELLGPPRWLVRYYKGDGTEAFLDFEGEAAELSLPPARVSPVLAWPYWPARRLNAGDFRPAGAILPYEALVSGDGPGRISLSWQGGVEAWFFEALNGAVLSGAAPGGTTPDGAESARRGENFDWPGFRALFSDPAVSGEFRSDPWLADWDEIAEKTLRSGFRKQWLKAAETQSLSIPSLPGPWVSSSPFVPPLETGVFKVRQGPGVQAWYSARGILHCAGASWILLPWG
jgi:hypothetical protein